MKQYKIAVVSEIHYMSKTLLNGNAQNFEPFITDRTHKAMVEWSADIFDQVISELNNQKPDILLIPGDLTKDGELISHQELIAGLNNLRLNNQNLEVYVVPGNFDINNPGACEYYPGSKKTVLSINESEFKINYKYWGSNPSIIAKDPNSLSYVAEPFSTPSPQPPSGSDRLWILAIDALDHSNLQLGRGKLLYKNSAGVLVNTPTMNWIETILNDAAAKGVTVLGLMHFNLIEHFKDEAVSPVKSNLLDNWSDTADKLMQLGLRVIFTGRHATDITFYSPSGGMKLYDIQTGSLVTPPSLYRIVNLTLNDPKAGNTLEIHTHKIQTIQPSIPFPSQIRDPQTGSIITNPSFEQFSKARLAECVDKVLPFPEYRNAFMAHVAGNETFGPAQQNEYNTLSTKMSSILNNVLNLQMDLNTDDYDPPKFSF